MNDIRGIEIKDFQKACTTVPPSVSKSTIMELELWRKEKGQI